jgi:hypothetical protein
VKGKLSWFKLFALCGTASFLVGLGIAVFVSSGTVVLAVPGSASPVADDAGETVASELAAQDGSSVGGETFAGLITDDHCGARHDMGSQKSPAECAKACLRNGAKYALVNGDRSYALAGNTQELSRRSGERVTLTGSLEGNTIQVHSVVTE